MRKSCLLGIVFSLLFFVIVISQSYAATIRHAFSGTITASQFNNGDPYNGQITVGAKFSGFYEFDGNQTPAVGDACQVRLEQCRRHFLIPPYSFSVTVGSFTFYAQGDDYTISINDGVSDVSNDVYAVVDNTTFAGELAAMRIALEDDTLTAIDDPRLLYIDPPNLDDFATTHVFQIIGNNSYFSGNLESLTQVTPPPVCDMNEDGEDNLGDLLLLQRKLLGY